MQEISSRKLKKTLLNEIQCLSLADFLDFIAQFPPQTLISSLFSFICSSDEKVRWHSISAFGPTMKRLADQDMEKARIVMRRFMWMLNDESGGIGWGVPEAFGETLACDDRLAEEYSHILISFTREDGFYLELALLQRGLMWGIGRAATSRSPLLLSKNSIGYLMPYLTSPDSAVKGLAARALGILKAKEAKEKIASFKTDRHQLRLFNLDQIQTTTVADLATAAIKSIEGSAPIMEH